MKHNAKHSLVSSSSADSSFSGEDLHGVEPRQM